MSKIIFYSNMEGSQCEKVLNWAQTFVNYREAISKGKRVSFMIILKNYDNNDNGIIMS